MSGSGTYEPTARLKLCLAQGSVEGLFPMLKDWDVKELQALMDDVEEMQNQTLKAVKKRTEEHLLKPENFFNDKAAEAVLGAGEKASMDVCGMCAEIASVAMYYLERKNEMSTSGHERRT